LKHSVDRRLAKFYAKKRKIRHPVNTKWIKIFKRRPEYMIMSRS